MLVLSRKKNERIVIGEGAKSIVITVVRIDGVQVRIGIDAPPNVTIHRQEVFERIQEERKTD